MKQWVMATWSAGLSLLDTLQVKTVWQFTPEPRDRPEHRGANNIQFMEVSMPRVIHQFSDAEHACRDR